MIRDIMYCIAARRCSWKSLGGAAAAAEEADGAEGASATWLLVGASFAGLVLVWGCGGAWGRGGVAEVVRARRRVLIMCAVRVLDVVVVAASSAAAEEGIGFWV